MILSGLRQAPQSCIPAIELGDIVNERLPNLVRLAVAASSVLVMWCGTAGLLYVIDSPTSSLNGGGSPIFDWTSLILAASIMTLLAMLACSATYALGLRRPIFGFAVFVGTFLLLEAPTWYLGENGSRSFGITPEIASLFEDDGVIVLLIVTNPLVSAMSGVVYAGSLWLLQRSNAKQNSCS